jgi:hypothetical protein
MILSTRKNQKMSCNFCTTSYNQHCEVAGYEIHRKSKLYDFVRTKKHAIKDVLTAKVGSEGSFLSAVIGRHDTEFSESIDDGDSNLSIPYFQL